MAKSPKNIKNSEYRIIKNGNKYEVWLVSISSGAKLKCAAKNLLTKDLAEEIRKWVKERES